MNALNRISTWRGILGLCLAMGSVALAVAAGLGAVFGEAASAGFGAGLALLLSAVSLLLVAWAERRAPQLAVALFLVGALIKLGAVLVVVSLVGSQDWIHPAWTMLSAAGMLVVWQAGLLTGYTRLRHRLGAADEPSQRH